MSDPLAETLHDEAEHCDHSSTPECVWLAGRLRSMGMLRAALDAAPPAGLRERIAGAIADISEEWAESAEWLAARIMDRLDDPDAAPSCGHPIDAERLARAMLYVYDVVFGPVAAAKAADIAAAYAREDGK